MKTTLNPRAQALIDNFPYHIFSKMWDTQREMFDFQSEHGSVLIESGTGTGKSGFAYTCLKTYLKETGPPVFFLTTNKVLLEQFGANFPDVQVVFGRNEHPCLYYEDQPSADQVPCSLLYKCPHRVDQETGEVKEKGCKACPYLQKKFEAKQAGGMVACTTAFYFFCRVFTKEFEEPPVVVIDEVHRLADTIRNLLSFEITEYHIDRLIEVLEKIDAPESTKLMKSFRARLVNIVKDRSCKKQSILSDKEIEGLIDILEKLSKTGLDSKIRQAVKGGEFDEIEERELMRKLELLSRDIYRYIVSLKFSLESDDHGPLNYTYAFWDDDPESIKKSSFRLCVKSYHVAPLIRKMFGEQTVCMSATIGDPETLKFETGIDFPAKSIESPFSYKNARIYLPSDASNLAFNSKSNKEPSRTIRKMVRACAQFKERGIRSLIVVISNKERESVLRMGKEEGLDIISYGKGMSAKEASLKFRDGEGDVLVGTAANYAEGVDLPKQVAPVIFFLRPGYPSPFDPKTQFEERRFGSRRWALWNWRVTTQAIQVRGRNIRGCDDLGVTFFMSSQFSRFIGGSLPMYLYKSLVREKTFDECVDSALDLLIA